MRDVARALAVAHDSGECIAHMDVKPENIFATSNFKVYKLGDWGRATSTCSEKRRKLVGGTSEIEGDSRYVPNEVLNDDFSNLSKSDVWSLGATALELLSGRELPRKDSPYRALREGTSAEANFQDFDPGLSAVGEDTKSLLRKMLDTDPLLRPSAAEVADACEEIIITTARDD